MKQCSRPPVPDDQGRVAPARSSWRGALAGLNAPFNPLRRRSDHLETAAAVSAAMLVVLALPLAILVGYLTGQALSGTEAREAATRTAVTATVLDDPAEASGQVWSLADVRIARISWTDPTGAPRSASAEIPDYLRQGATTQVWVTAAGRITGAPMSTALASTAAVGAGVLAEAGALALGAAAFGGTRWVLDRRRVRDWDLAWSALQQRRGRSDHS
jgi:hypothetical protein